MEMWLKEGQGLETEFVNGGTILARDWIIQASEPVPLEIFSSESLAAPTVFSCDQIPKSFGPHGQILVCQISYLHASFLVRHFEFVPADQMYSVKVSFTSFPEKLF